MSDSPVQIRPARPADAAGIVEVIRDGFAPTFQETMIYGCPGVDRFVADQLALPASFSDSRYTVAVVDARVVGAIELRDTGDAVVLNYVSVLPAHRAGGLARRLLREAIGPAGPESIVLDVLTTNETARRWYERLGFRDEAETDWWDVTDVASRPGGPGARVRGYPQAEAAQDRFGFSQVSVVTPQGEYAVGRLGAAWLRVAGASALRDPALVDVLVRLGAGRRVLALIPRPEGDPGGTLRATTTRMRAPLALVRDRLGAVAPSPSTTTSPAP